MTDNKNKAMTVQKHKSNKKSVVIALICVFTAGILIAGVYFMLFYGQNSIGKSVSDIENLTLHLSGMRISEEYEIQANGDKATISYYTFSYANGTEEKVLKKRTACETQAVIDALNKVDFVKWNGFEGAHPKGVTDGTMFRLTATINGGQKLTAAGSQNFPKHFYELEQWLYEMLKDCEEIG